MTNKPLKHLMYVEDDVDISYIAKLILEKEAIDLELCNSGKEALEKIPHSKPDMILLDVLMPGLSGIEVLEALKNNPETACIPVVFVTAKALGAEIDHYKALGAVDVIFKPFDPLLLFSQIQEIWNGLS